LSNKENYIEATHCVYYLCAFVVKSLNCNKNKNMLNKIEHIGIAVKNLESSNQLFTQLFGKSHYKIEKVESEHVSTSFFQLGESKIELLEATHPDSAIAKFIDKKGEGIHHIAYDVTDIVAEMERLKSEGFQLLNAVPKKGADNKLVCFLHPKSTNGVLIELCQEIRSGE
jgi:methylmalonyl-CoA/ethylmalonyl-CoA epimerase